MNLLVGVDPCDYGDVLQYLKEHELHLGEGQRMRHKMKQWKRKWLKSNIKVHRTAVIDDGAQIGEGTTIWHYAHVCTGATIGRDCSIGQCTFIDDGVIVGDRCHIGNCVNVWKGITLEDDVNLRPMCILTNDRMPTRKSNFVPGKTLIQRGASIGAGAIIVCGESGGNARVIGVSSIIGAGAVIVKNVASGMVVCGMPQCRSEWPVDTCGTFIDGVMQP